MQVPNSTPSNAAVIKVNCPKTRLHIFIVLMTKTSDPSVVEHAHLSELEGKWNTPLLNLGQSSPPTSHHKTILRLRH